MNLGRVLYNNLSRLSGVTYTYSGTEIEGKTALNTKDWFSYSFFQTDDSATTTLDFLLPAGGTVDTWSVYVATFTGTGSNDIKLYYESAPAVFTLLDTATNVGGDLTFRTITPQAIAAGRKLRYEFIVGTEPLLIRQLVAGENLEFPIGEWAGKKPPNLLSGVVKENTISQNGQVLGTSIRRLERKGNIDLDYLTQTWVRSYWDAFARHCARYAFIYQWNQNSPYDEEIAFAVANTINAPENSSPPGTMRASMPLNVLVADANNVI